MASSHRKLFREDPNANYTTTIVQTCLFYCHSQKNETSTTTTGIYCPPACLLVCPSVCRYDLEAFISPPDPLPRPNTPLSPHNNNLSPLLISMLIILASAFLVITFYVLYTRLYFHFYHVPQTRPNRSRPRSRGRTDFLDQDRAPTAVFHPPWFMPTVGLKPSLINAIAVVKYTKVDKSSAVESTDCAVCLAEFEEGEELRILPKCNHVFHIPCIDTWFKSHTNCPLCRAPVVAPDRHPTADNSAPPSAAAGESSPGEVRINVGEREENTRRSGAVNCPENKEFGEVNYEINVNSKGCGSSSSSSQRWELEGGAANLVSRSFSCGAKIFS